MFHQLKKGMIVLGLDATVPPAEEKNGCAGPAVSLSRQLKIRGDKSNQTMSLPDEVERRHVNANDEPAAEVKMRMSGGESSNKTSLSAVLKM